ncbi:MAG: hypothetical protein L0Z62_14290 [Gemmataceae bacterium]|nr:hypothetical protein [Gemmataceae bacterium]
MSRRVWVRRIGLVCVLLGGVLVLVPGARGVQAGKPKAPQWTHAFDLKCRHSKEPTFSDKTKTYGIEVFRDDNNSNGVYIIEEGRLAVARGFGDVKAPVPNSKSPDWLHGLDLKVRKANEPAFTEKTQIISMEVFRDSNTGNLIYITEKGFIATAVGEKGILAPTSAPKAPVWTHAFDLKVRKSTEKEFSNDTKVWSVEVFRDENTGLLLYVSETGAVAAVMGNAPAAGAKPKGPEWLHGLNLKCRRGGEKDFTPKTQEFGMEVFRDANNGNLIYICETGALAVVPGPKELKVPTPKPRDPGWQHGLDLKCRKFGEMEFTDKTRVFGIEVFRDENTNSTVYISEVGSISAVPAK